MAGGAALAASMHASTSKASQSIGRGAFGIDFEAVTSRALVGQVFGPRASSSVSK